MVRAHGTLKVGVQGSSNLSYLTKKGESQAETTQQLVGFQRAVICTESMVLSCGCSRGHRTYDAGLTETGLYRMFPEYILLGNTLLSEVLYISDPFRK